MTGEDTIRNFKYAEQLMTAGMAVIMIKLAEDATAMIKNRIINSGRDAQGQLYPAYSTTPMLTNCSALTNSACKQKTGSKKKRKELEWVTIKKGGKNVRLFELPGGYKEFRELHGRQTGFVDFAFSGRMWDSVQVVSSAAEHQKGQARISALSAEQMKKLEGHTERKGVLLDLSDEEVAILQEQVTNWVSDLVKKSGL